MNFENFFSCLWGRKGNENFLFKPGENRGIEIPGTIGRCDRKNINVRTALQIQTIQFGDHGTTYGGNLLACRAALVFLQALEDGLLERVRAAGARVREGLRKLADSHPVIGEIRGEGLIWGFDVEPAIAERMVGAAIERGLLINRTDGNVIRLLPPLTISDADIDEAMIRIDATLEDAQR